MGDRRRGITIGDYRGDRDIPTRSTRSFTAPPSYERISEQEEWGPVYPPPPEELQYIDNPDKNSSSGMMSLISVLLLLVILALIGIAIWWFVYRKNDTSSSTSTGSSGETRNENNTSASNITTSSGGVSTQVDISEGSNESEELDELVGTPETEIEPAPTPNEQTGQGPVLDCESDEAKKAASDYFNNNDEWRGQYLMLPQVANKVSDTECDIKYRTMPIPGTSNTAGIDSRRFAYTLNPLEVKSMKPYMSGVTTQNMGDTILDCNADNILQVAKTYYDTIGEQMGVYTMEPVGGVMVNSNNNVQCDIKFTFRSVSNNSTGTDYRRFTFKRDNNNEWVVDTMGGYISGTKAKDLES